MKRAHPMLGLLLALCGWPLGACALEVKTLDVSRNATVYHVLVDALIDAPLPRVRALLLDARALPRLDASVTAVRATEVAGGQRVESDLKECLFGFCRTLLHVQQVQAEGNEITALTVADAPGSSFKSGVARWQLSAEGQTTRLQFSADTEPDVWLPPLIGPRKLMQQLTEKTLGSLQALEHLARE